MTETNLTHFDASGNAVMVDVSEKTAAFRWLCEHAGDYGFILRYPKDAEDKTEIIYEPWHWRYVGVENAAKINASGLCFEDYIETLQSIAAEG